MVTPATCDQDNARALYQNLTGKGIPQNVAQALVINAIYESDCDPSAREVGGTGVGLWQWSFEQAVRVAPHLGDLDWQVDYMRRNEPDQWINVGHYTPWDDFQDFLKSDKDVPYLTKAFLVCWERAREDASDMRFSNAEQDAQTVAAFLGNPSSGGGGDSGGGGGQQKPEKKQRTLSGRPLYVTNNQLWELGGGLVAIQHGRFYMPAGFNQQDNGGNNGGGNVEAKDGAIWPFAGYAIQFTQGPFQFDPSVPDHDDNAAYDIASGLDRAAYVAPCDCVCTYAKYSSGTRFFRSTKPVKRADGSSGYIGFEFFHDNDASMYEVGRTFSQGEVIGHMGTQGFTTGVHVHFGTVNLNEGSDPAWGNYTFYPDMVGDPKGNVSNGGENWPNPYTTQEQAEQRGLMTANNVYLVADNDKAQMSNVLGAHVNIDAFHS